MTAAPVAIPEQRVKPPIRGAPAGKVVDQLDMAIAGVQSIDPSDLVQVECRLMRPRHSPERMTQNFVSLRVIDQRRNRQLGLTDGHRCRQYNALPFIERHDRRGQQITLAEGVREPRKIEVSHQVAAFDIDMCNPSAAAIEDLVAGKTMCFPARSSICLGQVRPGRTSPISTAWVANGAIGWAIGTRCSSPIGFRPMSPVGIGMGWLF